MTPEQTISPKPRPAPVYKANMPGVKNFAGRLNSMGYDGNSILSKWNDAVATSPALAAEKAAKLVSLAKKVGYEGDLWGSGPVQTTIKTPGPAAPVEASIGHGMAEIGKATWNGLAELVTGIARTPQVLHDAAGAVMDMLPGERSAESKQDSENINSFFKGIGDKVAGAVAEGKFDLDKSGLYSKGLWSHDASGDLHWNGLMAGGHSIGQSLGFALSMIGPGLASKAARGLGIGMSALRAAKAAGDLEKVATITKSMQGSERAMRYVGSVVSQTESLYQDALEATGDSHKASLFAAVVAPVVGAIDAFTGVESMIAGGGSRGLSKAVVKQIIGGLNGEITEESLKGVTKSAIQRYIKERGIEGAKQFATESVTETMQEGYQMGVERIFDRHAGNTKLQDRGGAADARLLNSAALGGLLGGSMGAAFHQSDAYHPTAFKILQDAYQDGGQVELDKATQQLHEARARHRAEMPEKEGMDLHGQIDQMASIVQSFKGRPNVDAKTQFQFYDLNYNQLPTEQQALESLVADRELLTGEQPTDPADGSPLDPAVAQSLAATLSPQIADQQQRVSYLTAVRDRLTQQGTYQDWGKGYDQIGKYQPGDRISAINPDDRANNIDGTVQKISEDGQTLTVTLPPVTPDEQPKTVEVRATEARPYNQPERQSEASHIEEAEEGAVAVHDDLMDGFQAYHPANPPLDARDRVVLADDTEKEYSIQVSSDADGNQVLTVNRPGAPISGTIEQLTDKANPNRIVGTYSPQRALAKQDFVRQQAKREKEIQKLREKLPASAVRAIESMDQSELTVRYDTLKENKDGADERKYIEAIAARSSPDSVGQYLSTPEASPASQQENTVDSLAADTPAVDETLLDAGEEIIDEQVWNQIVDSDVIPAEIIADIAARDLSGQSLTARQQMLLDGFTPEDEAVYDDAIRTITDFYVNEQDTIADDERLNEPQNQHEQQPAQRRKGARRPSREVSQIGAEGASPEGTSDVPGTAGPVQPELAAAPPTDSENLDGNAEPGSLSEATDEGTPGRIPDTQTSVSPEQAAVVADGERIIQDRLAQQALITERVPSDPVYIGPPTDEAKVGMDVRFTLNSGTSTLGTIVGFDNGLVELQYTNRRGQSDTWRFDPVHNDIRNKATGRAVRLPATAQLQTGEGIPAGEVVLTNYVDVLRKAFPRVKVMIVSAQQMQERVGQAARGAVDKGAVYINREGATADTPLHEYAHIYNPVLKKYHPGLHQRGLDLIADSPYVERVRESYPELKDEGAILEEALAQAIGERGVSLPTPTRVQRFMTWAKLAMRRVGEAIGFPMGMETTLDDYLKSRAGELLSGNQLSSKDSPSLAGEGVQLQRPAQATIASLPNAMDEAWLAANGDLLTAAQYTELVNKYHQIYDSVTDTYRQQRNNTLGEKIMIGDVQDTLDRAGGIVARLRAHANLLDHANLGRVIFGDTKMGDEYQNLHRQQLAIVAPMKTAGHDVLKRFHKLLNHRTLFRGATTYEKVEKWSVTGEINGKSVSLQIPVDNAVHMAAQYRSTMVSKGHFDPEHTQKTARGEEPTMGFRLPNADNPDAPIYVRLNKAELRALEDRVFYQDAGTIELMQVWADHANRMHSPVARIHRLMTGLNLDQLPDYFPLSPASTDEDVNSRTIETFVDDAGMLKNRQSGAAEWVSADGFLSAVNRYQRQAENFVQLSPLWQNLRSLAIRHKSFFAERNLSSITDALERQAEGYRAPDGVYKANVIKLVGSYDLSKLLRLATLSRFAFNVAIPLKQVTGFMSAFGSGAIEGKYLAQAAPLYFKMIGDSFTLVARGGKEGGYFGNPTDFDLIASELASIDSSDAHVLRWRMQGQSHPDIQFEGNPFSWGQKGALAQVKQKTRSFFEEYGLSISQRADTAVVGALYKAAKAQVKANNPGFTEDQVKADAVTRAVEALYYSNQTYDRTDRASIQFARNPVEQLMLLYKGQAVKIFNTMARRGIEVALAPDSQKKAARLRLTYNMGLNAVLAPLITTAVDVGVLSLRNLAKDEKEKENDKEKEHSEYLDYGMAYLSSIFSQLFPAELGEGAAAAVYMASNPSSKREFFNVNPVGVLADLFMSTGQLVVDATTKTYTSEKAFQKETTKALQDVLRAGVVRAGWPTEVARQVNHLIGNWLLPDAKPATHGHGRHRHRQEAEDNYGVEYMTGTEEETRRHGHRR